MTVSNNVAYNSHVMLEAMSSASSLKSVIIFTEVSVSYLSVLMFCFSEQF